MASNKIFYGTAALSGVFASLITFWGAAAYSDTTGIVTKQGAPKSYTAPQLDALIGHRLTFEYMQVAPPKECKGKTALLVTKMTDLDTGASAMPGDGKPFVLCAKS
jgi:hypothetical protein